MEFNEEKAKEIVLKHNLDEKTIRVWRTRNNIPNKYLNPELGINIPVKGEKQVQELKRIKAILANEKLNIASIARLSDIPATKIKDVLRGKSNFSANDLICLKKAITSLKIAVANVLSALEAARYPNFPERQLSELYKRSELSFFVVLNRDRSVYSKIEAMSNRNIRFPSEHIDAIKQALAILSIELTIN